MYPTERKAEIAGNQSVGRGEIQSYTVYEADGWHFKGKEWDSKPTPREVAEAIFALGAKGRANARYEMKKMPKPNDNFIIKAHMVNIGKGKTEAAKKSNKVGREHFINGTIGG